MMPDNIRIENMIGKSKIQKAHEDAAGKMPRGQMVGVRPTQVRHHARFSKTAATAEEAFFLLHDDICKIEKTENFFVVSSSHNIIATAEGFLATALVIYTAEQEMHH